MTNITVGIANLNSIVIGCDAIYAVTLPYSITDYDFEANLKTKDVIIEPFTVVVDLITEGKVWFSLTPSITTSLNPGHYFWNFIQTDDEGVKNEILRGLIDVIK
jgi:hypothetical protein